MSVTVEALGPQHEGWGPRYDLSDDELHLITHQALLSRSDIPGGRFVGIVSNDEGPLANLARTVERRVFEESFKNDDNVMKSEYGPYDAAGARRFMVVLDTEKQMPAGVISILENSEAGLKTLNDIEKPEYLHLPQEIARSVHDIRDLDKCWDVGTLAVLPEYRGSKTGLEVSTMLYRMFFLLGRREGVSDVVSVIDPRAYKNMNWLGVPFAPIADSKPFDYLGSKDSRAVYGRFKEFWPGVDRRARQLGRLAKVSGFITRLTSWESKTNKRLQLAARAAGMLASGRLLDEHISLGS